MGISTFLLFNCEESVPATDLLRAFHKICMEENLFFGSLFEKYDSEGTLKYTEICISDKPFNESLSRQIRFNVYDEPDPDEYKLVSFEWDDTENEYFMAVISEDFCDNEDLLLRICHALLKIYPTAKIWTEDDWFYTLEDLNKITGKTYK